MVLTVGHFPGFTDSHVDSDVARIPQVVAWAGFTGIGIPEVLVNLSDITAAKKIRRSIHRLVGAGMDRLDGCDVRLKIPVRRPPSVVKGRGCRQSGVPAEYA